jgi:hypothetical protein
MLGDASKILDPDQFHPGAEQKRGRLETDPDKMEHL